MVVVAYTLLGLLLVVLQTTILMFNPLWVGAPDLYYVLVAYLAYRMDILRGLIILFPLSWAMDVLSGVVLGTYPAVCFTAFVLLKVTAVKMPVRESLYQIPFIGVSYLVVSKFVYTILSFLEPGVLAPWSWPTVLLRVALLVVLAFPLFRLFELVSRHLQGNLISFKMLRVQSGNRYRQEIEKK
jgi:rod shape-determining protein MreD